MGVKVHRYNYFLLECQLRQNVRMGRKMKEWSLVSQYKLYTQHKEMGVLYYILLKIGRTILNYGITYHKLSNGKKCNRQINSKDMSVRKKVQQTGLIWNTKVAYATLK